MQFNHLNICTNLKKATLVRYAFIWVNDLG
jgi:hypothetical protein